MTLTQAPPINQFGGTLADLVWMAAVAGVFYFYFGIWLSVVIVGLFVVLYVVAYVWGSMIAD